MGWDFGQDSGRSIRTLILEALSYMFFKVEAGFLMEIVLF
jgi:hypothetical protein